MTIHRITIAGGSYEDHYEHHHHFSTQEKAIEYAESYVNRISEDWWADKYESVSYVEIELDTNLTSMPQYFLYDGNRYAPTEEPADKVTMVTNEEYWKQ